MRTEVDVLTLTATPIPRTLYMTLTGVRDISTINTPPEERLPIITHVGPYSPWLVRQAILRELERGGQVFFVHNRVQTIGAMRVHLEKLVPEARIVVAHGQMHEDQLSQRMEQFTAGEVDILLSTSIIESGLDIPNANTLIVDRADTFGLAQLYQLRGRVGRGRNVHMHIFSAINTYLPPWKDGSAWKRSPKTPSWEQDIQSPCVTLKFVAQEISLAHASTAISHRLDSICIRGYFPILSNDCAVEKPYQPWLKHFKATRQLQLYQSQWIYPSRSASLPHISQNARPAPALYRRLADLRSQDEIDALTEEFIDRFGPLPEETQNLFYQLKIKLMAEQVGLASVSGEGSQIILRYPPLPEGETNRLCQNLEMKFAQVKIQYGYRSAKGTAGWKGY